MGLLVRNLSDWLGAEALGVDLAAGVSAEENLALNQAFSERSVLVIRDQKLSPQQMLSAVQNFGEVFEQHNKRFALPECSQIHYISNQDKFPDGRRYIPGEGYHTDHSNDTMPPKATVLHAITLPSKGGDTQFVDMQRAYDDLDASIKAKIADVSAVHVYQSSHSDRKLMKVEGAKTGATPKDVIHPLVRTHPETGRKALYLNPIRIERLVGMPDSVALVLLRELLEHATQERYQYRHKWLVGDLVLWDNRCLLHKANGDYDHSGVRYLYRVMLKGGQPS